MKPILLIMDNTAVALMEKESLDSKVTITILLLSFQSSPSASACSLRQSPGSSSPQRWPPSQVQLFSSTSGPQSRGRVVVFVDIVVIVVLGGGGGVVFFV